nr:50S ribosomal protein L21 [Maliibacterium massiliense]
MVAVVRTGGKQYRVQEGDVLYVEKLAVEEGATVQLDPLMIIDGDNVKIGTPVVEGASVEAKLIGNVKGEKIIVFKMKSKKNYRKKQGHRQPYSKVEITKING